MDVFREVQGDVRYDEPMRRHSSFRIGGPADVFISPASVDDLCTVLRVTNKMGMPVVVIGAGTNLLVSDEGLRGCVVRVGHHLGAVQREGNILTADAGVPLPRLAGMAADWGLSGLEFAAGIPGSVGGAIVMNAGVHGADMSAVVDGVQVADHSGNLTFVLGSEMEFGYRNSRIRARRKLVVTAAVLSLIPGKVEQIRETMAAHLRKRRQTQPLGQPCAGSIFKNPPGDYAGRLIEQCGLKGYKVNDAMISPVHANFIVNTGDAHATDVMQLIAIARQRVLEQCGVSLQLELETIGLEGF